MKQQLNFIWILLVFTTLANSQTSGNSLENWFDKTVGKENLAINNGFIHVNDYLTRNNSNPYLIDSKFGTGTVVFENQFYDELSLNYDSFNDELLLKPNGTQDIRSVIVIKDKTARFTVFNKNFVNLTASKSADFIAGYYEETVISPNVTLYTKHVKSRSEKLQNDKVYSEFAEDKKFVLSFNNTFYRLNQSTLNQLYPQQKQEISNFYKNNATLEKANAQKFNETLLVQLESKSK